MQDELKIARARRADAKHVFKKKFFFRKTPNVNRTYRKTRKPIEYFRNKQYAKWHLKNLKEIQRFWNWVLLWKPSTYF